MSTPLLTYTIISTPSPLVVSQDGSPSYGTLTLIVSNSGGVRVDVTSITMKMLIGANAKDLSTEPSSVTTLLPTGWDVIADGGSFLLTPTSVATIGKASVSFVFGDVLINDYAGPTLVGIDEFAAPHNGTPAHSKTNVSVLKGPPAFSLSEITVGTPTVQQGGTAQLSWTGGPAAYTLQYDPGSGSTTITNLQPTETYTTVPLTAPGVIAFTLNATVTVPGQDQPTLVQRSASVTVEAAAPTITSFTGSVALERLTLNWATTNTANCTLTGFSGLQQPAGPTTAFVPNASRYTLTAVGEGEHPASVSRTLNLSWGLIGSGRTTDQFSQSIAVSPDGQRVYIAIQNQEPASSIVIHDSDSWGVLQTTSVPLLMGDIVLSPDGQHMYIVYESGLGSYDASLNPIASNLGIQGIQALVVSPDGSRLCAQQEPAQGEGASTFFVMNSATLAVESTIAVPTTPFCVTFTSDGGSIIVGTFANVSMYSIASGLQTQTVGVPGTPQAFAASAGGTKLYCAFLQAEAIAVIDVASFTVTDTINLTGQPFDLGLSSDGLRLFVPMFPDGGSTGAVQIIDTGSFAVLQTIPTSGLPFAGAAAPACNRWYELAMADPRVVDVVGVTGVGA